MHLVFLLFLVLTAGAKVSLAISGSGGSQEICVTLGRSRGEPSKVRTDVSLWHTLCSYSDVSALILLQDSASRLVVTAQTGAFQPFAIPVTPWTQLPAKSLGCMCQGLAKGTPFRVVHCSEATFFISTLLTTFCNIACLCRERHIDE